MRFARLRLIGAVWFAAFTVVLPVLAAHCPMCLGVPDMASGASSQMPGMANASGNSADHDAAPAGGHQDPQGHCLCHGGCCCCVTRAMLGAPSAALPTATIAVVDLAPAFAPLAPPARALDRRQPPSTPPPGTSEGRSILTD